MATSHPRRNGVEPGGCEHFSKFFEHWLIEQNRDLRSLLSAASARGSDSEEERRVSPLVQRVLSNYENYYKAKSASAGRDVLPMFTPTWTSTTENLFLWVGGWRPSTAFHLLYSKCGLQVESQLTSLIRGVPTGDLADLSVGQLERIDRLQRETIGLEKEISEEEASVQESLADPQLVGMSHAISDGGGGGGEQGLEAEIAKKQVGMQGVLERADQLRLGTLKGLVGILRTMQAVHFLIAAAELHLRVHEFGKNKDESNREEGSSPATHGSTSSVV